MTITSVWPLTTKLFWFWSLHIFRRLGRAKSWLLTIKRNRRFKTEATVEAQKVYSAIKSCKTRVLIVCDNSCTPPTIGDYLYFIVLARFFIAHKLSIDFIIVDSELRSDWVDLTAAEQKFHISLQTTLAHCLINSNLCNIITLSWENTSKYIKKNQYAYKIYSEQVHQRVHIYDRIFNLLNLLLYKAPHIVLESILFKSDELRAFVKTAPAPNSYVTVACRHSRKWGLERNLSEQEFLAIYSLMIRQFPDHSIMVVSDGIGCSYFQEIAQKHMLTCIFSKSYSSTFIGDAFLVLNSAFYFQLRGGGLAIIPIFSFLPFKIISTVSTELLWGRNKFTCLNGSNQVFLLGNKLR